MIWTLLYLAVAAWVLVKIAAKIRARVKNSTFTYRKHWALTLALPMVEAQGLDGFSSPDSTTLGEESKKLFRTGLLHYLELPPHTSDEEAIQDIAKRYEATWFRADLHAMSDADDPQAAIAFACVRVAFFTRILMLMDWIDRDSAWRVLLLNAQRAQECFSGWKDFGRKYLIGRRQWTASFRADPLGATFGDDELARLTGALQPWALMPWDSSIIFDPRKGSTSQPQ
jgi:hypothetical protein